MSNTKDPYLPFKKIKSSGNLPMIPQVLIQLIDICQQTEIDLQKAGKLIEKDAALAAKILQLCKSAFIGARTSFTDVRQATVYLGTDTVKNLAISVSVQQTFRQLKTNRLLNMNRFWLHSYKNAIIAGQLADAISYTNSSQAYLASLLHDIGKLLFWIAFPGKYIPLLIKKNRCHDDQLPFQEQKKFHINHCDAGAWLLKEWGLDNTIVDAVKYHHHPVDVVKRKSPLTRIVFLANLISHSDNMEQVCNEVANLFFRLSPYQVEELMKGMDEQVQEVSRNLGISIPQKHTLTEPPERNIENPPPENPSELTDNVRHMAQLTGFLDNLLKAKDINQIAHAMEQSLTILFNREKSFFILIDHTGNQLHGYTSFNNPLCEKVESITFEIEHYQDNLIGQAIELNQIVHSCMTNETGEISPIDNMLENVMSADGIMVIPMLHQEYKIGALVTNISRVDYIKMIAQTTSLQFLASQAASCIYMLHYHDITAKHIAKERLKATSLLARKIGHEINNPLAILRNYLKVIDFKLKNNDSNIQEELAIMDEEFARIGQITSQLNDIATETLKPELQLIDINKTLEDIIRLYSISKSDNSKVVIRFRPDNSLPAVRTDKNYLGQIIHNLLNNSFDSLCGEGTVTVSTTLKSSTKKHGHVLMTIHDDGPGIPKHLQKTIFQAGVTTKTGGHGGLGLAITARAVEALGGTVDYDSISGSTTFRITMPF